MLQSLDPGSFSSRLCAAWPWTKIFLWMMKALEKIPTNKMQHQNESVPIVKHQSRSGKKGRKLSGIFQSRVNSMGNLSLAINFSHCCSKDWVKAQKAISFYLFNLFPFFWHALIPLIQQFFLRFFWVCNIVHLKISKVIYATQKKKKNNISNNIFVRFMI